LNARRLNHEADRYSFLLVNFDSGIELKGNPVLSSIVIEHGLNPMHIDVFVAKKSQTDYRSAFIVAMPSIMYC
jgi:hypothetical protein